MPRGTSLLFAALALACGRLGVGGNGEGPILPAQTVARLLPEVEVHDGALEQVSEVVRDFVARRPEVPQLIGACVAANATGVGCDVMEASWNIVRLFVADPNASALINKMRFTAASAALADDPQAAPPMPLSDLVAALSSPITAPPARSDGPTAGRAFVPPAPKADQPRRPPAGMGTRPVFMGARAGNGTTASNATENERGSSWYKKITKHTFQTGQYMGSPSTFSHPYNVARDEYSVLTLWAFLWAFSVGERYGDMLGYARSKKDEGYPNQLDVLYDDDGRPNARRPVWTLASVVVKWKTIKAIFSTFDRWYDVYNKEATQLRSLGGVKKLCYDFLPFLWTKFSIDSQPALWGEMKDVERIFTLNDQLESTRLLKQKKHVKADGTEASAGDKTASVDDMMANPYWQKVFELRHQWETIKTYWGCENEEEHQGCTPAHERLDLVFNPKEKGVELPRADVRTCWMIMEHALESYQKRPEAFPFFSMDDIKGDPKDSPPSRIANMIGRVLSEWVVRKAALPFVQVLLVLVTFFLAARHIVAAVKQDDAYSASTQIDVSSAAVQTSTCSVTSVETTIPNEGVTCVGASAAGVLGIMKAYDGHCFRSCVNAEAFATYSTNADFRIRNAVTSCTDDGMRPRPRSVVSQNSCNSGANKGDWFNLEMAPMTPTPTPFPPSWSNLTNVPDSYRWLSQEMMDEIVAEHCTNTGNDGQVTVDKDHKDHDECQHYCESHECRDAA